MFRLTRLTCVKTCEKLSQASPAKLLKSVEYLLGLVAGMLISKHREMSSGSSGGISWPR